MVPLCLNQRRVMIPAMPFRMIIPGLLIPVICLVHCSSQNRSDMRPHQHTNALIDETSPYLLQHAHNPVNWYPWGEEAFQKAREDQKLIIVSIGYSSCHWCHVMEHESFEDSAVAAYMNEHFVSIKVDREERPDVDNIYMTAVQMLNQRGGWPLNCIALPDGRPIWGGTYFPKEQWLNVLSQISAYYRENPEQTEAYAARLAEGIRQNALFIPGREPDPPGGIDIHRAVEGWSERFDLENGGMQGAPKFPMPVNLSFLLHYGYQYENQKILQFVENTLLKIARGGIYDQAGGGFARYSVDNIWKVPHFEKMLYDNAQLVALYARAYQVFGRKVFSQVVEQSIQFLEREMTGPGGLFYSALDADSDGEEGKYYIWTREELENLLDGDMELFSEYYNVNATGLWEDGRYILYRTADPEDFARSANMEKQALVDKIKTWNNLLLEARKKRIRPGLDDKSLTSWNAMMISGLVAAYRALGESRYLELATNCASTIREKLWSNKKVLYRNFKDGKRTIPGFHIDYALFTEACLDLYEATLDQSWFDLASEMTEATMENFYDSETGMFRYNPKGPEILITHQVETEDNVIPSSNSVMARNLFRLGHLMTDREFLDIAMNMTASLAGRFIRFPGGFAGWGSMLINLQNPFYEIVVVGPESPGIVKQISKDFLPGAVIAGTTGDTDLPLFKGRYQKDKTRIFVCVDNVCQLPVENPEDAKAIYSR